MMAETGPVYLQQHRGSDENCLQAKLQREGMKNRGGIYFLMCISDRCTRQPTCSAQI